MEEEMEEWVEEEMLQLLQGAEVMAQEEVMVAVCLQMLNFVRLIQTTQCVNMKDPLTHVQPKQFTESLVLTPSKLFLTSTMNLEGRLPRERRLMVLLDLNLLLP